MAVETTEVLSAIAGSSVITAFVVNVVPKIIDYFTGKQNNATIFKHEIATINLQITNETQKLQTAIGTLGDKFDSSEKSKERTLSELKVKYDKLDDFVKLTLVSLLKEKQ